DFIFIENVILSNFLGRIREDNNLIIMVSILSMEAVLHTTPSHAPDKQIKSPELSGLLQIAIIKANGLSVLICSIAFNNWIEDVLSRITTSREFDGLYI
ncbi:hypothetical protein, partial [Yersinia alsatica]|uniref:hypothetical protein n=1 Tax=Yersinia alsatica TaxID=2890317 RepID=UPI001C9755C5